LMRDGLSGAGAARIPSSKRYTHPTKCL
ncbi:hypothetical protein A2U01_0081349, partial [Trifolium medium]|nr:hypothetical protein [Trifolium medium]